MMPLHSHDVHLWTGQFVTGSERHHWSVLNGAEQERAQRFVRERDRHRYIWARGNLRCLLGDYLGIAPEAVAFCYGDRGKPYLAEHAVQFNLSHSGDWVVYAFTGDRPIGVDIEQLQRTKDWLPLAERFFCTSEAQALAALPLSHQTPAFFKLWTRKEAYLKATGEGLQGLQDVAIAVNAPEQVIADPHGRWQILDLTHISNYAGALSWQIPDPNPNVGAGLKPAPTDLGAALAYESSNLTHFSLPT
ncbi:MAG: 4'-phosphopantetheinyl transferase superfamily protein [Cyanobacteria bacterium P01_G01_bin.54]